MQMWASEEQQQEVVHDRNLAIALCGKQFLADRTGALYWPSERALIIADMHLEKASSYAAHGQMLPPYDTRATLMRLADTIDFYETEMIIALGDSFHDIDGPNRMHRQDREVLELIVNDRNWYWLVGNHDPELPTHLGGTILHELELSGLTFRHEPISGPVSHEIAGHMHPAAKLTHQGATLRRPAFVSNRKRMIMPAFGTLTGGLNVMHDAFAPMFGNDGYHVWMLGEESIYPISTRLLRAD